MVTVTETASAEVDIASLRDHVIVCSLKGVGLRVVELLHLGGAEVVVIDDDPNQRHAESLAGWGVPYLHHPGHLTEGLRSAGIDAAAAVICADTDERAALEVALQVRGLRGDVRLVVQMENAAVGEALRAVVTPGVVLNSAAISAPSFIEVCIGRQSHSLELEGRRFDVVLTTVPELGEVEAERFRDRFGSLAPVAIIPQQGGEMALCPGRDHPVSSGDRVAVLGTQAELAVADLDVDAAAPPPQPTRVSLRERIRHRSVLSGGSSRGVFLALGAILALVIISTVVVELGYRSPTAPHRLSPLTSLYFVIETVATVGFGDFSFAHQAAWMQIFAIILIVLGVTLTTVTFVLFTNLLVGRRIDQSLGRREVAGMAGHTVVVGLGSLGIDVVEGVVASGRQVVVIERDDSSRYLGRARALGIPVVIGDATLRQTLSMVNLSHAASVVVLSSDDFTNIETALVARDLLGERWGEVPVILRVLDRNLAQKIEERFGFRHVRSTAALAAPWFVGAALGLDLLASFFVDRQPFLVGRLPIAPGGGLQGLAMADLSAQTRVIALRRSGPDGDFEHPPRRGTRFEGGDQAYLLGADEEILRVLRQDQR